MMGHEWLTGAGLVFLGIITGFVGTNTGGSVFLTVPVMIWLGIAPQSSIATARLASVGTMVAGLRHFHQQGKVDYALAIPAAVLGLAGALGGASLLLPSASNRSRTAAQSHWRADITARCPVPYKKTSSRRNPSLSAQASVWLSPVHPSRNDRRVIRWASQTLDVFIHHLFQKNHQRIGGYPQSRRARPLRGLTHHFRCQRHRELAVRLLPGYWHAIGGKCRREICAKERRPMDGVRFQYRRDRAGIEDAVRVSRKKL